MGGKKLLVFSDSHGHISALKAVFTWANERIPPNDTICAAACLGDGLLDINRAAAETGFYSDWKIVLGNNDYSVQAPESAAFDFVDRRIYLCHGHRHGMYGDYNKLLNIAKVAEADVALFGHSHVPFHKKIDGIHIINPGSVGRPRSKIGATFAVIEITEDEPVKVQFYGIFSNGEVHEVKVKES